MHYELIGNEVLTIPYFIAASKALGIGAASFASFFGQQSTVNGQQTTATGIF